MSKIIIKKRFIKKIKIKIIVADQFAKSKAKRFILGQLFSPVLSKIEVIPKLGLFHTSLVIGPWLIEWNVIKKIKQGLSIVCSKKLFIERSNVISRYIRDKYRK
jgi:hypothetical protein